MSGQGSGRLLRSAAVVGAMTLLSRLTGLLQTFFLSHFLGAGAAADAYAVAFRLPNLLRRFTAEGTMTAAFLPTLAQAEREGGEAALRTAAAKFLGTLLALLLLGVALGIAFMGPLSALLTYGRPEVQGDLTARLARIMFPYLALVSLTAGLAGVLNLRGRFALASAVSIFWNLAFIGFGLAALAWGRGRGWTTPEHAATVCAFAVLAGGLAQLLVLVPAVRAEGFGLAFGLHLGDPYVRAALKRMGPGLLAAGIYPINALVSTVLASKLPDGAQIVLYNSGMMGEMVLGLFAMSFATAGLPALARLAEDRDWEGMGAALHRSLAASSLLVIPACAGLAVLARPACALLFRTGAYTAAGSDWTAATLQFQCAGLLFVAAQRIGTQALYALKDYRGPAAIAVATLLLNIGLSLALMGPLGTGGLALSNGLASLAGMALLALRLRPRLPGFRAGAALKPWLQAALAAGLMAAAAWQGAAWLGLGAPLGQGALALSRSGLALRLLPLIAWCAVLYFAAARVLGHAEARALLARLRR